MTIKRIAGNGSLDPITVYFDDLGKEQGYITIHCFGTSWTCYFGAMGTDAESFFNYCGIDYLTGKLSRSGESRKSLAYLERIVKAIKSEQAREAKTGG